MSRKSYLSLATHYVRVSDFWGQKYGDVTAEKKLSGLGLRSITEIEDTLRLGRLILRFPILGTPFRCCYAVLFVSCLIFVCSVPERFGQQEWQNGLAPRQTLERALLVENVIDRRGVV